MNYTKKAIVKPARSRRGVRKQSGFTLIEILVVMAIIAMLAVMVAPNIFNQQAGAQRDAAISQISSLQAALDMYRLDIGEYPDGLEGLVENDTGGLPGMGRTCAVLFPQIPGAITMFIPPVVAILH